MKKKTKLLSLISTALAGFALSLGPISSVHNKKASETKALYSPSTHYEVSDTASELNAYYSSASGKTGDTLLSALRSINSSKYHKNFSYSNFGTSSNTSPYVYTDYPLGTTTKDNNGQIRGSEIASFYTKTTATSYNKEHVWPKSKGGDKVEDDILMPRPTINSENSSRGNSNFIEGKNSNSAGWDPYTAGYDKECRGECARIMLYCVVASSQLSLTEGTASSSSSCGDMNTLIKWHFDYAPSVYEMNRNNGAEYLQGNRNPFVDHPEYVAQIWSNYNSTVASYCSQNSTKYSNWVPGNYCNYGENTPVTPNTGVTISSASESISVGSSTTLSATSTDSGTITWSTSNSSVASLSSTSSASGASVTVTGVSAGTATITAKRTISGTVYSQTCTVNVTKVVSSLSKGSTSPSKTTYIAGESFDPTGLTITATYSDSTTGNVTSSVVWSPDPLTAGTTSVTGTFGGKSITITGLTVNAPTEPEIIDSNSDLSVGDYVVLRTAAGVGVTGWNNNKDATVSETKSEWKKFYVASVSSSGFTLKDESADNYIASPGSSNQFIYGSAGTCSTDSDGHLICNNRYLCKNGTNYRFYSSVGSYLPFFIYKVPGLSSTKTLSSISVYTSPTKLTYTAGETFDPTGLVITRTYSDSSTDQYSYANHTSEFTFSPSTSTALTTSNTSVTIAYGGKSTAQAITVNAAAKTLSSIAVSNPTTSFTVDDSFTFGGTVTATFSDSTTTNVTSSTTFSGYNMSVAGTYTVTASYTYGGTTKTATYQITVTSSGGSGGQTENVSETIDLNEQSYSNTQEVTSASGTDATVTFAKNNGSNTPKYYTSGSAVRLYPGNTMTVSSSKTIISITITFGSGDGSNSITSDPSGFSSPTWSGSASSVTFTIGGTSGNRRIASIEITYEETAVIEPVTSISATVSKTYYVGETITSSDLTVKDNNNKTVTGFSFANDGYQFTYADAASGGAITSKTFTNAVSYSSLICSLTVQVQRKAYCAPTGTQSLEHTGSEFSIAGIGSSYATGQTATVDGISFSVDGYVYSGSKLSLSQSKTSAPGKVVNTAPYPSGITNVTVSGASPDIQLSSDGSTWVDLASAQTSTTNYYYLKLYFSNTSQSNYVNITSFTVTMKAFETPENVANYIMYEDTNNQCVSKLPIALGYYKDLSTSGKSEFQTSDDLVISTARKRLNAWADAQGKTINYSTGELSSKSNMFGTNVTTENGTTTIIIVALISTVSLTMLLVIKKKRMH